MFDRPLRSVLPTVFLALAPTLLPTLAPAQSAAQIDQVYQALALDEMVEIMREEGLEYGDQIAADLFSGRATAEWTDRVEAIYDAEDMADDLRQGLAEQLQGVDVAPMIGFFESEPGRSFVKLEASARRALLDEAVEQAAQETAAAAMADRTPRFELVERFVETNQLIDTNVVGAMNANYAFYLGLMDGGAMGGDLSTDEILSNVWSQEAEIRQTTTEWIYGFLTMAYQPASDADLETYLAFSDSDAGTALNRAVFAAFDAVFVEISRDLGRAAAKQMTGEEI